MTTKLIAIDTDTHVVVPREPTPEMLDDIKYLDVITDFAMANRYKSMLSKAPQLTTPPVLRWEDNRLYFFGARIGVVWKAKHCWGYSALDCTYGGAETEQEARRAAEDALGLPIVEEV